MNVTPEELRTIETVAELEGQTFENVWISEILTDRLFHLVEVYISSWALFFLASLGVVTNSLVIIVFLRQGFRDSVNVSLFSIAVWDMIKCISEFIFCLDKPIGFVNPVWGNNWRWVLWQYLTYLPIFSGYVSYALATYVSIERCLSVSIPFKRTRSSSDSSLYRGQCPASSSILAATKLLICM
ncbi:chemosensory receptor B [Elysia marginata]|uniref:Chemosensory receptor B n=1 Tax=Elysia marginata TaxID=1093978 RepID=A0AAV4J9S6_9GAST|nr:chemosensory receptor B [Elysia marginata]